MSQSLAQSFGLLLCAELLEVRSVKNTILLFQRCPKLSLAHLLNECDFLLAKFNIKIVILGVECCFVTLLHAIIHGSNTNKASLTRGRPLQSGRRLVENGMLGFIVGIKRIIRVVLLVFLFFGSVLINLLLLCFALGSFSADLSCLRQVRCDLEIVLEFVAEGAVDFLFDRLVSLFLPQLLV